MQVIFLISLGKTAKFNLMQTKALLNKLIGHRILINYLYEQFDALSMDGVGKIVQIGERLCMEEENIIVADNL